MKNDGTSEQSRAKPSTDFKKSRKRAQRAELYFGFASNASKTSNEKLA